MEIENITMQYISVWMWHIQAIMFLIAGLISGILTNSFGSLILFFAFIVYFVFCESIAYARRNKLNILENLDE